ncbi:hypothetical protein ACTXT7_012744, partial [Hymenolepis weldensis]
PKGLNLDVIWCVSHTIFTAFIFLLLHWNYLLPSAYLDLLHRCALHLGCWHELSTSAHSGYLNWQAWSFLQYNYCINPPPPRGKRAAARYGLSILTRLRPATYPKGIHVKHVRGLFESVGDSNAAAPEVTFEWSKLLNLAAISPFSLLNLYRVLRNRTVLTWIWNDEKPAYESPPTAPIQTANTVDTMKS